MWLSSPVNTRPEFGLNYRGEMHAARRNERFIRASRAPAGALGGRNLPAPARSDMRYGKAHWPQSKLRRRGVRNGIEKFTSMGRGHRLLMLEEFIAYIATHEHAGFTTCRDYVRRWRKGRSPSLPADAGANRLQAE